MAKMFLQRTSCLALLLSLFVSTIGYAQTNSSVAPAASGTVSAQAPPAPSGSTETPDAHPARPTQPIDESAVPSAPPAPDSPPVPQPFPEFDPPVTQSAAMPSKGGPTIWGSAVDKPITSVPRWYGLPATIAMAASDVLLIVGLSTVAEANTPTNGEFLIGTAAVAVGTHALAGPINHWAHGHTARGFVSLLLNAGVPLGMLIPGGLLSLASNSDTPVQAAPILGGLVFNVIDVAYLSRDDAKVPLPQRTGAQALLPSAMAVLPVIDSNQKGLAFVGRF